MRPNKPWSLELHRKALQATENNSALLKGGSPTGLEEALPLHFTPWAVERIAKIVEAVIDVKTQIKFYEIWTGLKRSSGDGPSGQHEVFRDTAMLAAWLSGNMEGYSESMTQAAFLEGEEPMKRLVEKLLRLDQPSPSGIQ